ncbi:MAG: CBS domain-containing protein [Phenylobacterium sp.]|jgi:CBS domain-containing protein|uniref:CBS domain-containing protein n=1 Tax=Phenylobacterium sp. TaxID=1871053 RepID=UPI003918FD4B
MKVSEIMSRDVQVARPDESIQSVAKRMKEIDVGSLPVCDGDKVQGVVTDRDIAIRAVAEGRSFESAVSDIMTPDVEYVFDDDDAAEAADRMADSQIRRLPVVDRDKRLVGILALGDLTGKIKDRKTGQTLEEISEPTRSI